jgi:hypothetical protein
VTVTPLRSLGGLPGRSRLIAGVQLQPDGLRLMRPATLTIHTAANAPLAARQPFGYYGTGQNFYLQPFPRGSGAQSINLMHFSADGEIRASNADRAAQATSVPGPREAAALQALSEALSAERRSQLLGQGESEGAIRDLASAYTRAFFEETVLPHMIAATTTNDLDFAERALQEALSWERSLQLLGVADAEGGGSYAAERAAIAVLFPKVLKNMRRIMVERCKRHDVTMVPRLILLERQTQLLGVRESSGDLERADKCARFVLEFDSVYDIDYAGGTGSAHHHVHATVPLRLLFTGPQQAPIHYTDWSSHTAFSGSGYSCSSYATTTVDGTFTVTDWGIDYNAVMPTDKPQPPADPLTRFVIDPGDPQAYEHVDCNGSSYDHRPYPQWRDAWINGHVPESTNPDDQRQPPWDLRKWVRGAGATFATKRYDIQTGGGGHETTTLALIHKPEL